MGLRDLLSELKSSSAAAVRGVGSGATAGLHKYPAASLMILADKLVADNPQLTFREAMELINEQQQTDRTERPVASYGGEVLGSIIPASKVAKAATGIPSAVAGSAVLGGLSGFNEKQDLRDAAQGAAIGGVFGGAGEVAGAAQEQAVRFITRQAGTQRVKEAAAAIAAKSKELKSATGDAAKAIKKSIDGFKQSKAVGENLVNLSRKGSADELFGVASLFQKGGGALGKSALTDVVGTQRGRVANAGQDALGMIGTSAIGYATSHLTGLDPTLSAALGIIGGRYGSRAANPVIKAEVGALASVPRSAAPIAGAVAGNVAARPASSLRIPGETAVPEDEFDQFLVKDEDADADEFDKFLVK